MKELPNDIIFMKKAFLLAQKAQNKGEVPVGAIITYKNQIISSAFNQKEQQQIATSHAEILALKKASKKLKSWRLNACTMYVTLEPCTMCAGAIVAARLYRLVYACKDPKAGGVHSLYNIVQDPRLNHFVQVHSGVLKTQCSDILVDFFKQKRKNNQNKT